LRRLLTARGPTPHNYRRHIREPQAKWLALCPADSAAVRSRMGWLGPLESLYPPDRKVAPSWNEGAGQGQRVVPAGGP
jgi:hypothetical protein